MLEGRFDAAQRARGGLVLCHPHPRMGGTMNAPLLGSVTAALVEARWSVLRFNFRGIGASQGEASTGIAEVKDALAALDLAGARAPAPLAAAGWSFGGAVAVRAAAEHPGVAACVAIAPAVNAKPEVTAGLPSPTELGLDIPVLFVAGANDEVAAAEDSRAWVEGLPRGRFVSLPGANHFFWAKYDDLARTIVSWLDETVPA